MKTKFRYTFFNILTGLDLALRRLPFMIAESNIPGPVIWLTACGHGDEVGGLVVIQEIFKMIRKRNLLKGSIRAFPLMNPIGFETTSRNITHSKEDLNRSFPGKPDGSLAERIADKIFSMILKTNPTLVLDLHNDWVKSIPYTVIDPIPEVHQQEIFMKTETFAKKSGFLVIADTDELKSSLTYSLIQKNVPALTLELGESYIVNERNIEYGVKSICNILTDFGMIESSEPFFSYPLPESLKGRLLKYSDKPFSSSSGIIRFLAKPGSLVKSKQPIAKIYNAFGKLQETILAINESIILGHSDYSVSFPGIPVMAFGVT